ncbi:MAG: leucyl aminopeptidase family protein [Phycicoccus sp.]|nr:leucyl aminopeptidase family protein [Phycicoccus sp.]
MELLSPAGTSRGRPRLRLIQGRDRGPCAPVWQVAIEARATAFDRPLMIERDGTLSRLVVPPCPEGIEQVRAWGRVLVEQAAQVTQGSPLTLDLGAVPTGQLRAVLEGLLDANVGLDVDLVLGDGQDVEVARVALDRAIALSDALTLTRRLVDARGNQCTPPQFAEVARQVAQDAGLGFRLHTEDDLRREGMGGLLAIGSASSQPALLVELWYRPGGPTGSEPAPGSIALIGKGVTFDSGGLSLKPPAGQVGMHTDKAGAAAVLGAMSVLSRLAIRRPVHAVLPLVENLPGPKAVRPGDVVRTRNGLGVEVVDTDFEGRVIMADALAWATEYEPSSVIDIATLTYQAMIALGPEIGAAVARDDDLGAALLAAADRAGEPLWGLPWAPRYAAQIRSTAPGAHVKNHPGTDTARALTAALFLGEFVPAQIPWVHLDVAGPAVRGSGASSQGTGFGVRTLIEFLHE